MYDHQERLERENTGHATHLAEIAGQIAFHEAEIANLREIHRRLTAIDKIVHPKAPVPKKKTPQNGSHQVSEETLQEAIAYLRNAYPQEDIYTSLLSADEGWTPSDSHTSKILNALHEREVIALSKVGQGGRKVYRVLG